MNFNIEIMHNLVTFIFNISYTIKAAAKGTQEFSISYCGGKNVILSKMEIC